MGAYMQSSETLTINIPISQIMNSPNYVSRRSTKLSFCFETLFCIMTNKWPWTLLIQVYFKWFAFRICNQPVRIRCISFHNYKCPRLSTSASSSANVSDATPVQLSLTSTPALPPTPVREDAVSEGDAASSPTAKDACTTSDEDVNYSRWAVGCIVKFRAEIFCLIKCSKNYWNTMFASSIFYIHAGCLCDQ